MRWSWSHLHLEDPAADSASWCTTDSAKVPRPADIVSLLFRCHTLAKAVGPSAVVGHLKMLASCCHWWLLVRLGWWRRCWEGGFFPVGAVTFCPARGQRLVSPVGCLLRGYKDLAIHHGHSWDPQGTVQVPLAVRGGWGGCGAPGNGEILRRNCENLGWMTLSLASELNIGGLSNALVLWKSSCLFSTPGQLRAVCCQLFLQLNIPLKLQSKYVFSFFFFSNNAHAIYQNLKPLVS